MAIAAEPKVSKPVPWYHGLTKEAWRTLLVSNLGWMFDGYETYALVLVAQVGLAQILPAGEKPRVLFYQGLLIGITLLGWAVGGILWGIAADYIGRKRAMMYSILWYALFTGLTFFVSSWWMFTLLRFLTGLGLGAEWGAGSALLAEKWPEHARTKGAGLMQSGLGIGFFLASIIWLTINPLGPQAWRWMFLLGVLPALFVVYMRSSVRESEKWSQLNVDRTRAREKSRRGETLNEHEHKLSRFTLTDLFADPVLRKHLMLTCCMSLSTTIGWWGVSTWIPAYSASVAKAMGLSPTHWAATGGIWYNVAAVIGYVTVPFIADVWGRRWSFLAFSALSVLSSAALFLLKLDVWPLMAMIFVNGFFTMGQFTFYPMYLPELYPTRVRATAMAFVFNVTRFIAFLGPIFGGILVTKFGGIPYAAASISMIYLLGVVVSPFLKETMGQPLPD